MHGRGSAAQNTSSQNPTPSDISFKLPPIERVHAHIRAHTRNRTPEQAPPRMLEDAGHPKKARPLPPPGRHVHIIRRKANLMEAEHAAAQQRAHEALMQQQQRQRLHEQQIQADEDAAANYALLVNQIKRERPKISLQRKIKEELDRSTEILENVQKINNVSPEFKIAGQHHSQHMVSSFRSVRQQSLHSPSQLVVSQQSQVHIPPPPNPNAQHAPRLNIFLQQQHQFENLFAQKNLSQENYMQYLKRYALLSRDDLAIGKNLVSEVATPDADLEVHDYEGNSGSRAKNSVQQGDAPAGSVSQVPPVLLFNRSEPNMRKIKRLLCHYITKNRKYFNKDVVKLPQYERVAPFHIETMQYADRFLPEAQKVNKEYGFDEDNLQRNKLLLEKVFLERLLKAENQVRRENLTRNFLKENVVPTMTSDAARAHAINTDDDSLMEGRDLI